MGLDFFTSVDFAFISLAILAALITIIIFLKLGRPSNWFSEKETKVVKGDT